MALGTLVLEDITSVFAVTALCYFLACRQTHLCCQSNITVKTQPTFIIEEQIVRDRFLLLTQSLHLPTVNIVAFYLECGQIEEKLYFV